MTLYQPSRCVHCLVLHECVSGVADQDATPDDGDWSFCFSCGHFSIFDHKAEGGLRKPNVFEEMELATSDNARLRREWNRMHAPRRH